jgi:hypothetical protein
MAQRQVDTNILDGEWTKVRQAIQGLSHNQKSSATDADLEDHNTRHQNGGGDEVNVAGLSGQLADEQIPIDHDHSGDAGDGGVIDASVISYTPAETAWDGDAPIQVAEALDDLHIPLSAGWVSGGGVTKPGDPNIDVAAGTGYLRDANSATASLVPVSWAASNGLAMDVNDTTYVGVEWNNSSPQVTTSLTESDFDEHTSFILALVVNEGGTLHVESRKQRAGDIPARLQQMLREVFGIRRADELGGILLGETGALNVTVSAGEFYYGLDEFPIGNIDTSGADTFDSYYDTTKEGSGISAWDATQWNKNGVLTGVSNNKWYCHWFYLELDGGLVSVYGTAEHLTQTGAEGESPPSTLPERLNEHGTLIGRYIFKKPSGEVTAADEIQSAWEESFVGAAAAGDVSGPAASTDNAVVRYDGASGKLLQNSGVTVDDSNNLSANTLTSTVAGGTAPLTVTSTTVVPNLNVDQLDGQDAPTGTIVGTTDAQTLSAKTLTTPTIGDLTNATHDHSNAAGGGTLAAKYRTRRPPKWYEYPEAGRTFTIDSVGDACTMVKVEAATDTGTVTFNIERRTLLQVDAADGTGTDVLTADLVADDTGENTTTFDNSGAISADEYLVGVITSVASSPTKFWGSIEYTID